MGINPELSDEELRDSLLLRATALQRSGKNVSKKTEPHVALYRWTWIHEGDPSISFSPAMLPWFLTLQKNAFLGTSFIKLW